MFNAAQAEQRIKEGKAEFVQDELGYGLRRQITKGDLIGQFHTDRITERTGKALLRRGYSALSLFGYPPKELK